jgi:phosphomannomutase
MSKNIFIFDVDGTLTPSRGRMNKHFAVWFSHFCDKHTVHLVTGSDRPKTIEQIGEYIYFKCKSVYQCSGNEVWSEGRITGSSEWTLPHDAHEWLSVKLTESNFGIRTGNHFEHRTGMVNFSIVGRNADRQQRAAYVISEQQISEREIIATQFNLLFPNLQATVGGETGIDIAPRGSDKSQILRDFNESDSIHFYGDAMHDNGNDYPLAHSLLKMQLGFSHPVTGWQDTWKQLKEIT